MVVVAQLVELLVVVQAVAGSNPVDHPKKRPGDRAFLLSPTHSGDEGGSAGRAVRPRAAEPVRAQLRGTSRTTRAGEPTTTVPVGTSFVTTDAAATTASSPIVTPGSAVAF